MIGRVRGVGWVALLASALSQLLLAGCGAGADAPRRPHIVLLLADDLGWNDVGFHAPEIATPHLDALAAGGVVLDQFYVLPACTSTRAALLTGRYPMRYGLQASSVQPHATFGLPLSERTLARALHDAGYRTAILGKWHLGHARAELLPQNRGFDVQYGHYNDQIGYFDHLRNGGLDWHRNGETLREEGYATTLVGREAVRLIRGHDASTPLFLYVPFLAAHTPMEAPPGSTARYAAMEPPLRRTFAAMVTAMDDAIGEIVAALDETGMRENTLLLFASDNGANEAFGGDNGPLRGGKYRVYEGGVRVPALASWPGVIEAGRVERDPIHVVDLFPTLLGLAGGTPPASPALDGLDVWPTLARGAPSPRDEFLVNATPSQSALRRGPWKLVVKHGRRRGRGGAAGAPSVELFDLAADPGETRDLSAQNAARVQDLFQSLRGYEQQAVPPLKPGPMPKGFRGPPVWGVFGDDAS